MYAAILLLAQVEAAPDAKQLVLDSLPMQMAELGDNGVMFDEGPHERSRFEYRNRGRYSLFIREIEREEGKTVSVAFRNAKYLATVSTADGNSWELQELIENDNPRAKQLRKTMKPFGRYDMTMHSMWKRAIEGGHWDILQPPEREGDGWIVRGVGTSKSAPHREGTVVFHINEDGIVTSISGGSRIKGSPDGRHPAGPWESQEFVLCGMGHKIYKNDPQRKNPRWQVRFEELADDFDTSRCFLSYYGIDEPSRKFTMPWVATAWCVSAAAIAMAGYVTWRRRG